ncbi:hypothetical protein J6590_015222 [Homalodisca vitripennis]|nr:hypothetical protein J6590_015222 [Homalodisca vitripennis]
MTRPTSTCVAASNCTAKRDRSGSGALSGIPHRTSSYRYSGVCRPPSSQAHPAHDDAEIEDHEAGMPVWASGPTDGGVAGGSMQIRPAQLIFEYNYRTFNRVLCAVKVRSSPVETLWLRPPLRFDANLK